MANLFKNWFGKKRRSAANDILTAPIADDPIASTIIQPKIYHPSQVIVGSGQSVGRQRDHNEDTLFYFSSVFSGGDGPVVPFCLFIVADGMGGHQHGEIASQVAASVVGRSILTKLFIPRLDLSNKESGASIQEVFEESINTAHEAVQKSAPGGGTTFTAALLTGDRITFAHVGDSRAYIIHTDGRMVVQTQDHSLVRRLVELGQLTEEQAVNYPQKNVLYKAIGQPEPIRPDISSQQVPSPGYLLLCSDGLWGVVPESQIAHLVTTSSSPSEACRELIETANNAGGPDNISAIVVQFL